MAGRRDQYNYPDMKWQAGSGGERDPTSTLKKQLLMRPRRYFAPILCKPTDTQLLALPQIHSGLSKCLGKSDAGVECDEYLIMHLQYGKHCLEHFI